MENYIFNNSLFEKIYRDNSFEISIASIKKKNVLKNSYIWHDWSIFQVISRKSNLFARNISTKCCFLKISSFPFLFAESAALPTSGVSATLAEVRDEPRTEPAYRRLSQVDRILLESLDIGRSRPRPTGRFLTMHKRRRKRLTTRSLTEEPSILDDIFHGLVQVSYWSYRV